MAPIHYAAAYGNSEAFGILARMDNNKITNSKWNCLDLAIDNNHV
jgi:hypothetical protein